MSESRGWTHGASDFLFINYFLSTASPYISCGALISSTAGSFALVTFCGGVDGVNCWDRTPLGKGWRMRPGWNQGQEHQLGSTSQQVKREKGNELASLWLLFPGWRCCSETLKWGSSVPWALQLVLPCSSPPCCLHCHGHLQPASSTLHSQHISKAKSFLPLLPSKRGQSTTNLTCSRHACSLGALVRDISGRRRKFLHYLSSLM